jgi:hypothetical protein
MKTKIIPIKNILRIVSNGYCVVLIEQRNGFISVTSNEMELDNTNGQDLPAATESAKCMCRRSAERVRAHCNAVSRIRDSMHDL